MVTFGQIAYEGYCKADPLPRCAWFDLSTDEKVKWESSAQSVLRDLLNRNETPISLQHVHD